MWTDLFTVLSQYTRVIDGRTDGQTDRILIARPRLHSMQRGKNCDQSVFVHLVVGICRYIILVSILWMLQNFSSVVCK